MVAGTVFKTMVVTIAIPIQYNLLLILFLATTAGNLWSKVRGNLSSICYQNCPLYDHNFHRLIGVILTDN